MSEKKIVRRERARLERMLHFERILWERGAMHVAGVDEVGLGALAGPVIACAVVMPADLDLRLFSGLNDSKQLTAKERERLSVIIQTQAIAVSIGASDVADIARLNIYHAGVEAMRRAVNGLTVPVDHVLIDGRSIPGLTIPQNSFTHGDAINFSIAAASIVAKVYRDHLMTVLHGDYPAYAFDRHKGYATRAHWQALKAHGPSRIHRTSYEKIRALKEMEDATYEQEEIGTAL